MYTFSKYYISTPQRTSSKYKNFLSMLQLWFLTSWVAENSLAVVSLGESLGHHCETSQQDWLIGQFLTSKVQALP